MKATLFDIVGEFQSLYEMATDAIDEADGVYERAIAEKAFSDTLESLKGELTEKAAGYVAVRNRLQMEQKKAEQIVQTYQAVANSRKRALKRMDEVLLTVMNGLDLKEMPAGDMTIKVKGNGGLQPLVIDGDVPDNMTKITVEPDNAKIREYLKDNQCDWAHLEERGKHIEVK